MKTTVKPRRGEPIVTVTHKYLSHAEIDVFDHLAKLGVTKTSYVVGSGARGRDAAKTIPDHCYAVACNGAITLPVAFDAWAAHDAEVLNLPYFTQVPAGIDWIMGTNIAGNPPLATYAYDYHPPVSQDQTRLEYGVLHSGATIAGCMLQLLYWAGAEHIKLCGIDMFGNQYHDNSVSRYHMADTDWGDQKLAFEKLIELVRAGGCEVSSISETALNL